MNKTVDNYLINGCGRCSLGGTPDCKVHRWTNELELLRTITRDCGLTEEAKWGVPCYTFQGKNIMLISAFKDHCSVSFFKGSLLRDTQGILVKPGPNSQAARLLKFTEIEKIKKLETDIKAYIYEAVEVEKAGLKVNFKKNPEPIPEELENRFEKDPVLKTAFEALTPGRQRGYILYFSAPKQSKTRNARIEKCIGKILNGEGLHDKYQSTRR
ncbi:YdeI/OmpD-associated family protein [Allomuricauda sp. SCSIO 65647]|uniref:YdeI/OmpD-associated family protein n=1 Tax=Allomuricauda sp. SCSIO 65647 TaxID=2908843 RepID=UPI001F438E7B|nr:YdeI/OmpD-associated family protein [Muricauda sp. SCSIO 65647]UJH67935.1 YdeI/OmpD-associated family protein [Muricauda sp. SCSIO 65647]